MWGHVVRKILADDICDIFRNILRSSVVRHIFNDGSQIIDTIVNSGTSDGAVVLLRNENASRVVTIRDNIGNIQTKNNTDIVLDANIPTILMRIGTSWYEVQRPDVILNSAGSFTPELADATSGGNEATFSNRDGRFEKTGTTVNVWITFTNINTSAMTGSNQLYITGLPFTGITVSGHQQIGTAVGILLATTTGSPYVELGQGATFLTLFQKNTTTAAASVIVTDLTSGTADLKIHITYETA